MPELRELIREILIEVLDSLPERHARESVNRERVVLRNSADLNTFARSLIERAQDDAFALAVRDGRHVFDLDLPGGVAPPLQRPMQVAPLAPITSVATQIPALTKLLITERDVAQLAQTQGRLRIGSKSRLTPLAADELKRRGVKIERIPT